MITPSVDFATLCLSRRFFWATIVVALGCGGSLQSSAKTDGPRFQYHQDTLVMTDDSLRDANGAFTLDKLPSPSPKCRVELVGDTSPLTRSMWQIALDDMERNRVTHESGATYFGAGTRYGDRVYTRDISIAGALGVNRFFPQEMLSSLKLTREIRRGLGYRVSAPHVVPEIKVGWKVIAEVDREVMAK